MSKPSKVQLEIYLRGGHVLALWVLDWKIKKSSLSGITELTWTMANNDKMPFVSLDDVVAVIERG